MQNKDERINESNVLQERIVAGSTPTQLFCEHEEVRSKLNNVSSVPTAMAFGALLLDPQFQSNCVRIEALVHLAIASSDGSVSPTFFDLAFCFAELGKGICGRKEDPAEDVFVGNVTTVRGNFRVLEGAWESGTFYLQRFIDILETTPISHQFNGIRESTYALLALSDAVCMRAGLTRNMGGNEVPVDELTESTTSAEILRFTRKDCDGLAIDPAALNQFILTDEWRERVTGLLIEKSPLQFLPVIRDGDDLVILMPTAVSFCIRTHLANFFLANNYEGAFVDHLALNYERLLKNTPLLGKMMRVPVAFRDDHFPIAEFLCEEDPGRYFHFLCFCDTLEGFAAGGLLGNGPNALELSASVGKCVANAVQHAQAQPGYCGGITVAVYCGYGRACSFQTPKTDKSWHIQELSAPDLITLSLSRGFSPRRFWTIVEAARRLQQNGVLLQNVNGFLNLVGWMQMHGGQIVPHADVPKSFRDDSGIVYIPTNCLLDVRVKTTKAVDRIAVVASDGQFVSVRRENGSHFSEDNDRPLYIPEYIDTGEDIPFVFISGGGRYWCAVTTSDKEQRRGLYDRWSMLIFWLPRIVDQLESYSAQLPERVSLRVNFTSLGLTTPSETLPTRLAIEHSIIARVDGLENALELTVGEMFERGQQQSANVSERCLVQVICQSLLELADCPIGIDALSPLVDAIVVNDAARHMHAFHANSFRDYVAPPPTPLIEVDEYDSASLRIGLAFRVESRRDGRSTIRSRNQATRFLGSLVSSLQTELIADLCCFDRSAVVEMALQNHEAAVCDQEQWMRTARSSLALRRDQQSAAGVITKRAAFLSAIKFPCHVLLEIAVCECPLSGGRTPGEYDLARWMNMINAIMNYGGWSDAIHFEAMPPHLSLTALGDVQADTGFRSDILMPFFNRGSVGQIKSSIDEYDDNFRPRTTNGDLTDSFDSRFLDAWNHEAGFSLEQALRCLDELEDFGIRQGRAVYETRRSEIVAFVEKSCTLRNVEVILEFLTLKPRDSWQEVPNGYDEKDIQLWRFRRQLSAIRRPIVQLDQSDDPVLFIAPGFIRDCFGYVAYNYYEGTFPERHYRTPEIKQWHIDRNAERGSSFATLIAGRIQESPGWNALAEQKVTSLILKKTDINFGDVDVVAWNESQNRLLMIECKHLYHGKTFGEVAEQLRDYRGVERQDGRKVKRDDLRKHLDRLEILTKHKETVCRCLKLEQSMDIEGWIIFKNPVPMMYAWKKFENQIRIATSDDLSGRILDLSVVLGIELVSKRILESL